MNGKDDHKDDARRESASAWIARLQGDDLGEADGVAFDAWLNADAANAAAYDAALATWTLYQAAASDVLDGLRAADRTRARSLTSPGRRWFMAAGGLAAAAAVAAVVVPDIMLRPQVETYATGKGERRTVALADGSTIDLNAETRLTVTLARRERSVVMDGGQAVFDVAHDARRPFEVAAADHVIRVLGTQFDVRNRSEGLAVTVGRGSVEVRPGRGISSGRAYVLHPGQRLEFGRAGAPRVEFVDAAATFSWRIGHLVYRDEPLSLVVGDLNRQFQTPIRIEDPKMAAMPVSGVLVVDDQDEVLQRLALMLPARTVRSERGVLLQPR